MLTSLVNRETTIFWFRRDFRLDDNAGLSQALRSERSVIPVFIFDTEILTKLSDPVDRRVKFIYEALLRLKAALEAEGSSLLILYGNPPDVFRKVEPKAVYTNEDYEPYGRARDKEVEAVLNGKGARFYSFKDQVVFSKNEIVKDDGSPYTVFTPYSRRWKQALLKSHLKPYPTKQYLCNLKKVSPLPYPLMDDIGFRDSPFEFPARRVKTSIIENYHKRRDFPGINGTSRLSVHLRFGTVSIRRLVTIAREKSEAWLNELIWREFYQMILWHFPGVTDRSFKRQYDHLAWRNDPEEFKAWCAGKTGYPIVDAGMRELNETGFMHNRVRMITASFLTKHLLIDWRWGEAYFAEKLLDYELASNNGGWQWAAGTGCDAAPYFRMFNPALQAKKFDPALDYVRQWVPELETDQYPRPLVNHREARERVLRTYSAALKAGAN